MAVKSNLTEKSLARRLEEIESIWAQMYGSAKALFDLSAGSIQARRVNMTSNNIAKLKTSMQGLVGPELVQYAKDQRNNQSYDIVIEYQALIVILDAFLSWIDTSPINSGTWSEVETIVNGEFVARMLTPASTASLRVELQKVIDAIEP